MQYKRHNKIIQDSRGRLQNVWRIAEATPKMNKIHRFRKLPKGRSNRVGRSCVLLSMLDSINNKNRSDQKEVQEAKQARKRLE